MRDVSSTQRIVDEAGRIGRFDYLGSSAQALAQSMQHEHRRALERATGVTSAIESLNQAFGLNEALNGAISATGVLREAQSALNVTNLGVLASLSSITGASSEVARRFKSDQRDWLGLKSIASGLIGLQPISDSVASAVAQLNATNALSVQGGVAAQMAAINSVTNSYDKYFSGIESQQRSLLKSVGSFARTDKELAAKLGSILSIDSNSFGSLNPEALTAFAGSKLDAFSSLNSVLASFTSAIGNPAEYSTLVSASQSLAESSRRMLDSVANSLSSLSGQQAASNIISLADFSAARALGAIANQANALPFRPEPMRRRRVRKSSKRQAELKVQLRELIAVSTAGEHLVTAMQPLHQEIQQLNQKAGAAVAISVAAAQSRNSWKHDLALWIAILSLLAALAQIYKDYYPSQLSPIVTGYVTASDVNLRLGPATTQTVIMKLGLNLVVEIKQKRGTWCQVLAPSPEGARIGWMHQRYIKAVEQDSVQ
jgi:hypothetical protein